MGSAKIVSVEELGRIAAAEKASGRKVALCHGVFDLLHIGHIRYFEQARAMGDVLMVTVTPDRFVDKGPGRPAFPEGLRAEAIASLSCVDHVAINEWPTAVETLKAVRPDVYVKGWEYRDLASDRTGKIQREAEAVKEIGAQLSFARDIVFSSTNLINRFMSEYPQEVQEYMSLFRSRHTVEEVTGAFDRMKELRVLLVGDVILDEYVYCEAIGKSSKDPILAVKYLSEDRFAGGVLAVANHLAAFVKRVDLVTILGAGSGVWEFITRSLHPRVSPHFVTTDSAPVVTKRRLVEGYSLTKLMEIYTIDEKGPRMPAVNGLCEALKAPIEACDLVVAADFGHGALHERVVSMLCEKAPFLAVNTQANAGNRGFNVVTRYPRADYISIAEHELRLSSRDAHGELRRIIGETMGACRSRMLAVTRGKQGCVVTSEADETAVVPAFAMRTVDRVGAGDAFFSVTAPMAALGLGAELTGFVGNAAGADAVAVVGNRKSISRESLSTHITALLK